MSTRNPATEPGGSLARPLLGGGHPPFVDRMEPLWWLERRAREALDGRPRFVMLPGDAGVGKTRLGREFSWIAQQMGFTVCIGRAVEGRPLPYLPVIEALRWLHEEAPETGGSPALDAFFHPERSAQPADEEIVQLAGDRSRMRLFLSLSDWFVRRLEHQPLLVVFEDLHWFDPSSVDLLTHLATAAADAAHRTRVPLMVVATYRASEVGEHVDQALARLRREEISTTLELSGFDESQTSRFVSVLGLERASHQLLSKIYTATKGNPLFIQAVVRQLREAGRLEERGGFVETPLSAADLRLPSDLAAAVAGQLESFSLEVKRALTWAAFLGDRFELAELASVTDMDADTLLDGLEAACDAGVLAADGSAFRFHHPLAPQVLRQGTSGPRAQRIHARLAELRRSESTERSPMAIAHHLISAGGHVEPDQLVETARAAGDQAFGLYAWGDAARFYTAAASAAERCESISVAERGRLWYRAGVAHNRDHDVGPCIHAYRRAVELFEVGSDVAGLGAALDYLTRAQFTLAATGYGAEIDIAPLEKVLAQLGSDEPHLRGAILATMSEACFSTQRPDEARVLAGRALKLGEEIGDDTIQSHACFGLGLAELQALEVEEALSSWRKALQFAQRAGDTWLQQQPKQRMAIALLLLGRTQEASEVLRAMSDASDHALRHHAEASLVHACLASIEAAQGDLGAAEASAREAIGLMRRASYWWSGLIALPALAYSRTTRGSWAEALDAIDGLVEPGMVFPEPAGAQQLLAAILRELIELPLAKDESDSAQRVADLTKLAAIAGTDASALSLWCALAEIAIDRGHPELVEDPERILTLASERGVVLTLGWTFLIPRVLGRIAVARGRLEEAEQHLSTALRIGSQAGTRPELLRTQLDMVRMLADRNRGGDAERAAGLLDDARLLARQLGAEGAVGEIGPLANKLSIQELPAPERPDALTELESQILALLAEGRADREIAQSLVLRPDHMEPHLDRILAKLGVGTRAAAAAWAVREGVVGRKADGPAPLTILVDDIESFSTLVNRLGDERGQRLIHHHNRLVRASIAACGGSEITHRGDGIMASFRAAPDALRCAIQIQRTLAKFTMENPEMPLRVRVGLNSGEPLAEEERLFGTAVNLAVRICDHARPGQILASRAVREFVESDAPLSSRGEVLLKGYAEPVGLYEVDWASADNS